MLAFALILFMLKVVIAAVIPDQAGWVRVRLLATKYQTSKRQAQEANSQQAEDAIRIERAHIKQNMHKLQAGAERSNKTQSAKKND